MIRAIANKRLDLSDQEFEYFKSLKDTFGENPFKGIFETNNNGIILGIMPPINNSIPMPIIFFMFNVMMNQRLRFIDQQIGGLNRVKEKMDLSDRVPNIIERLEKIEAALGIRVENAEIK